MNCGIYCVREYLKLQNIDERNIVEYLEAEMTSEGISVSDIIRAFRENGLRLKAFRVRRIPEELPVIIYLPFFRHFIIVTKRDCLFYHIADNMLGYCRIPRAFFRFLFSNVIVMMI